jgi:hypothetical protein
MKKIKIKPADTIPRNHNAGRRSPVFNITEEDVRASAIPDRPAVALRLSVPG